ncbi:MAG: hypothetical protein HF981_25755 [Desulfobacteraceae bacterium]|nr:hypothetical protein [Desulfobacteraceae bacterium]MBC2753824.1 hypothetical protein [Desulfobacteraceae bacterium]
MDSYLIRIYRRSPDEPENLVGVVENIDTGQQQPFNNLAGMCQAVSASRPHGEDPQRRLCKPQPIKKRKVI